MSNAPDGAQISDDGQWWWDGENWQPMQGGTPAGSDAGAASFDFDSNGLLISAENSPVPSANEALKASFAVCNMGTAAGSAHVTLTIDGSDTGLSWDSPTLQPGQCAAPSDGYIHDVPGQTEGRHTFEVTADPAGPYGGKATNEIDVGSAE
jgi:hypothetical protein